MLDAGGDPGFVELTRICMFSSRIHKYDCISSIGTWKGLQTRGPDT